MTDVRFPTIVELLAHMATPPDRPWAGVVVIHDVAGMSQGLKNRARWRASGVPGDHPWEETVMARLGVAIVHPTKNAGAFGGRCLAAFVPPSMKRPRPER